MANKKEGTIGSIATEEKKLTGEVVKKEVEDAVERNNKLIAEKERLIGEVNKIEAAIRENAGRYNTLMGIHNEYFGTDAPSTNGEA